MEWLCSLRGKGMSFVFTAEGMRNQEIAPKLNLSEHTVRNYLIRIFDKLGISNPVELVLYALSGAEDIENVPAASAARLTGRNA